MSSPVFPGFPLEGIQFLRGLAENNNRDWFLPRKTIFEDSVKRPMEQLVQALNGAMLGFAPHYVTNPAKAVLRVNRDARFSRDKSPYKEQIAASFPRHGLDRHGGAGFYFAVSHRAVAAGGGIYMPLPETLRALRAHIAERHQELLQITGSPAVRDLLGELQGEQLAHVPKGFAAAHPAAGLLRMKYFLLYVELPVELATTRRLFDEIESRFRALVPFLEFLNAPLLSTRKKLDARDLLA